MQASALAEDRVDTEAARVPIAETLISGTALGKSTNKPRATTLAMIIIRLQLLHLLYIKCFLKAINRLRRKKEFRKALFRRWPTYAELFSFLLELALLRTAPSHVKLLLSYTRVSV